MASNMLWMRVEVVDCEVLKARKEVQMRVVSEQLRGVEWEADGRVVHRKRIKGSAREIESAAIGASERGASERASSKKTKERTVNCESFCIT